MDAIGFGPAPRYLVRSQTCEPPGRCSCGSELRAQRTMTSAASLARVRFTMSDKVPSGKRTRNMPGHSPSGSTQANADRDLPRHKARRSAWRCHVSRSRPTTTPRFRDADFWERGGVVSGRIGNIEPFSKVNPRRRRLSRRAVAQVFLVGVRSLPMRRLQPHARRYLGMASVNASPDRLPPARNTDRTDTRAQRSLKRRGLQSLPFSRWSGGGSEGFGEDSAPEGGRGGAGWRCERTRFVTGALRTFGPALGLTVLRRHAVLC